MFGKEFGFYLFRNGELELLISIRTFQDVRDTFDGSRNGIFAKRGNGRSCRDFDASRLAIEFPASHIHSFLAGVYKGEFSIRVIKLYVFAVSDRVVIAYDFGLVLVVRIRESDKRAGSVEENRLGVGERISGRSITFASVPDFRIWIGCCEFHVDRSRIYSFCRARGKFDGGGCACAKRWRNEGKCESECEKESFHAQRIAIVCPLRN